MRLRYLLIVAPLVLLVSSTLALVFTRGIGTDASDDGSPSTIRAVSQRGIVTPDQRIIGARAHASRHGDLAAWQKRFPDAKAVELVDEDVIMVTGADGSMRTLSITPGVIDGATSVADMIAFEPELYRKLHEPLNGPLFVELRACKRALLARGAIISAQFKWTLGARWVGDGATLKIVGVVVPDDMWPTVFDEEAKACWTRALQTTRVDAQERFDRLIEMSFCVYPETLEGESK